MVETDAEARIRLSGELLIADSKISAIKTELETYHARRMTTIDYKRSAWVTIELIEKILDGSYFDIPSCSDKVIEVEK